MTVYTYKVIPAPEQGKKGRGMRTISARFANGLEAAINDLAVDGWEYVRSDSLPSNDRVGLTRKRVESFQNVLVFRKPAEVLVKEDPAEQAADQVSEDLDPIEDTPDETITPDDVDPTPEDIVEDVVETVETADTK